MKKFKLSRAQIILFVVVVFALTITSVLFSVYNRMVFLEGDLWDPNKWTEDTVYLPLNEVDVDGVEYILLTRLPAVETQWLTSDWKIFAPNQNTLFAVRNKDILWVHNGVMTPINVGGDGDVVDIKMNKQGTYIAIQLIKDGVSSFCVSNVENVDAMSCQQLSGEGIQLYWAESTDEVIYLGQHGSLLEFNIQSSTFRKLLEEESVDLYQDDNGGNDTCLVRAATFCKLNSSSGTYWIWIGISDEIVKVENTPYYFRKTNDHVELIDADLKKNYILFELELSGISF